MMRYDVLVNLKEWAEREGVHHVTAYRWFREGKLPVPARKVGRLILVDPAATEPPRTSSAVVYARVSSSDQQTDLDRQVARVTAWATRNGMAVDQTRRGVDVARRFAQIPVE
jgi:predicted site-specific integrase-resolvase